MSYNNNNYNNNYNNDEGGGSTALVPLSDEAKKDLAMIEPSLGQAMMDQFFMMQPQKNGKFKIAINKAGLYWKTDELYRGKYDIETKPLPPEEHRFVKTELLGFPESARVIIMKSELNLYLNGGRTRKFTAYGTVTPDNVKKKKNGDFANAHLLELAETRAECRVLKKLVGCGFSLANENDNYDESDNANHQDIAQDLREPVRKKMFKLFREQGYTSREDYIALCSKVLNKPVETTKNLNYHEIEKINAYMEGKETDIIDAGFKVSEPIPDQPPLQKAGPSKAQLSLIQDLYSSLNWNKETQGKWFDSYSKKMNKTINSERDLDPVKAGQFIDFLRKQSPIIPPPEPEPEYEDENIEFDVPFENEMAAA